MYSNHALLLPDLFGEMVSYAKSQHAYDLYCRCLKYGKTAIAFRLWEKYSTTWRGHWQNDTINSVHNMMLAIEKAKTNQHATTQSKRKEQEGHQ